MAPVEILILSEISKEATALYPRVFWTSSKMRKTKLIILPTKCLNTMGFLLLYLSCPVIADWGRNRPDTEMSQWSILLDKEGSCGLIRNSREREPVTDGWKEYQEVGSGTPRNDTSFATGYSTDTDKGNSQAYSNIQRKSERRIAKRETGERRSVSLDRRNAIRRVENLNRNSRNTFQERRNDARRLSLDRRVRFTDKVIRENVRNRQRRESGSRRMENVVGSRRVEERRLSRRIENDDGATRRVSSEMRRSSRVRNVAERRGRREERRTVPAGRSSSEREMTQARRQNTREERRSSPRRVEARRVTSNKRVAEENRTARREQNEPVRRRNPATPEARRTERSPERREASQRGEVQRLAVDISRGQNSRGREYRKREVNAGEKMPRVDRYGRMESRISKRREMESGGESKWELLDGIKNWFRQKTDHESWVVKNDFATTCLVGAGVYLLTARPIKSV